MTLAVIGKEQKASDHVGDSTRMEDWWCARLLTPIAVNITVNDKVKWKQITGLNGSRGPRVKK